MISNMVQDIQFGVHITDGETKEMFVNSHQQFGQSKVSVGKTIKVNATDFNKVDYDELYSIAANFLEST